MHDRSIKALRIAVGVIFIWFGTLKLVGASPVADLLELTFPFMAEGVGHAALGALEVAIGISLLTRLFLKIGLIVLGLHMLGTLSTFLIGTHVMFDPYPPYLTVWGEFVLKNIVLVAAAFVVYAHEETKSA